MSTPRDRSAAKTVRSEEAARLQEARRRTAEVARRYEASARGEESARGGSTAPGTAPSGASSNGTTPPPPLNGTPVPRRGAAGEASRPLRDDRRGSAVRRPALPHIPGTPRLPLPGMMSRREMAKVAESLPGMARIAAGSAFNTAGWSISQTTKVSRRLLTAATDPSEAAEIAHEFGVAVGTVTELAQQVAVGVPLQEAVDRMADPEQLAKEAEARQEDRGRRLRARGQALLAQSRDVWHVTVSHPAYERILDQLAPDEARILVLLYQKGPQPSVDIRTGGLIGKFHSDLIAPGLTMIGARAGCRNREITPAYLNNLHRLGLIWFSREAINDPMPYQVLEVQPDVLAAINSVKFAAIIRRSIHLTPFGEDFCAAALVDEDEQQTGQAHSHPDSDV